MKTFEERLERESASWVEAGLITMEQRARVLAQHPTSAGGGQRFMAILAGIGGTLLAVGVSLIVKANWEALGDWVKIGGLVALLAGAHWAGWRLKMAPGNYPKTGDACFAAGAVFFLLGIALVSQIFHLNSRPPNGVLLWWTGIVALPWITRAKLMQVVSVIAGVVWLGLELGADDSWLRLAESSAAVGKAEFTLFAAAGFLVGMALLGCGLGLRGGAHAYFAGLHEKAGLLLANWGLYAIGFTWTVKQWQYHAVHAARIEATVVLLALAGVAALWAAARNRTEALPLGGYLALGLVPVLANLCGLELRDSGWLWGGLACLAMFVLNVGMIRAGLATGREGWINLGMAGIALNVVTRYFLLFGTMLEGGLFFIVTGLLVLGLGWYLERKRRTLVAVVRKEAVS